MFFFFFCMDIFIIFLPRVVFINIKHNTMLTQNLQNDQKTMLHQRKKIGHITHGPHPALWHSCQRFQSPRIPYCDSKQKLFTASELYWNCSLFVCLFFLSFIFLTFRFQPHEGSMFRYAEKCRFILLIHSAFIFDSGKKENTFVRKTSLGQSLATTTLSKQIYET